MPAKTNGKPLMNDRDAEMRKALHWAWRRFIQISEKTDDPEIKELAEGGWRDMSHFKVTLFPKSVGQRAWEERHFPDARKD